VPELNLAYWISFGIGQAPNRDQLYGDLQSKFFPRNNQSAPYRRSNSTLPSTQTYMLTRRPYTTPDKWISLISALQLTASYDESKDSVSIGLLSLNGFDSYSFTSNEQTFPLPNYPFLMYNTASYITFLEPIAGFDQFSIISSFNFLSIFASAINFIVILSLIIHMASSCCCPCQESDYKELDINEFDKPSGLSANTIRGIFIAASIFALVFQLATIILLFTASTKATLGDYSGFTWACILPFFIIVLFVLQISLLILARMKNANWNLMTRLIFYLLTLMNLGNIIFCFLVNAVGPRI